MFPRIPSWEVGRSRCTSLTRLSRVGWTLTYNSPFSCFDVFLLPTISQVPSTLVFLCVEHLSPGFHTLLHNVGAACQGLALLLRTRVAMTSLPTPGSSLAITLISVRLTRAIGLSVRFCLYKLWRRWDGHCCIYKSCLILAPLMCCQSFSVFLGQPTWLSWWFLLCHCIRKYKDLRMNSWVMRVI